MLLFDDGDVNGRGARMVEVVDDAGDEFSFVKGSGGWVWGREADEGIPVVGRVVEGVADVVEFEGEA